jgi:hypothetical protein
MVPACFMGLRVQDILAALLPVVDLSPQSGNYFHTFSWLIIPAFMEE